MVSFAFLGRLSQKLSSLRLLRHDQRGAAAIEFAAVGSLMALVWVGCAEVVAGVGQKHRVTVAARTVADLATRFESLNNADRDIVLGAGSVVLRPDNVTGKFRVTLVAVNIDEDGVAKVGWSETIGTAAAHDPNSALTLPSDVLRVPNSQLIWCRVSYEYKPVFGGFAFKTAGGQQAMVTLSDQIYMRPRRSEAVVRVP
jgi:Flp pilus assembly protein TadG